MLTRVRLFIDTIGPVFVHKEIMSPKSSMSLFTLFLVPAVVFGHTYHMGKSCATVEPMSNFNMEKFLGKWYAIQKTSSSSRCIMYNFGQTDLRKQFTVQQISENGVIGVVKDNTYKYRGVLETSDEKSPSDMTVKFPLNVVGKSSFIVFMTDYDNYAGIYTCQTIGFVHRESATILSRTPELSSMYIDKIRNRLSSFNVNPYDLTSINHTACSIRDQDFTIDINESTFSKDNIKKTLSDAGHAISNGVSFLVNGAKKVYNSVQDSSNKGQNTLANDPNREVEETQAYDPNYVEPSAELL